MEDALLGPLQEGADLNQAVEGLEGVGQIAEHEEQRDHEDDLGKGQVDVALDVQERIVVILLEHAVEVEHAGSHGDAERDGQDQEDGEQRLLRQGMGPGHGDEVFVRLVREVGMFVDEMLLGVADMPHIVDVQEVIDRRDRLEDGQLEDPPDEELHAEQDVARQGDDRRGHQDQEGYPAVEYIPARKRLPVMEQGPSLQQGEDQQDGREQDVQQAVGDEGDPQRDHDEAQQQNREIQADALAHPLVLQADDQRDQDGRQHPGELHEELGSHRQEILLGDPAGDHDRQGEDDHGQDQGHLEAVRSDPFLLEERDFPGQELRQKDADEHGDDQPEQDEERESGHHRPAPLAVHVPDRVGAVLVDGVTGGLLPIAGEVLEEGAISRLAFDEDTVLDGLVPLLGVVVAGFQERGGLRVMRAVAHQLLLLHPAGIQQALRVEDTAVPVDLTE